MDRLEIQLMTDQEAISFLKQLSLSRNELTHLNKWVKDKRNTFYSNPQLKTDENGELLDFVTSLRTLNN